MTANLALAALLLATPLLFVLTAKAGDTLKPGDPAPNITAKDQDGKSYKLADFAGKQAVLVYFYPKDNTPGCTKEACGFRDRMEDLKKSKVQVLGVSFDTAASHQNFIAKYNLNFPLLVDTDGAIADAFGARKAPDKNARRVSFLIGVDGKIAHVTDSSSADTHLEEMQKAIAELK
jgi:peroxiredoxin Q/BCP